MELTPKTRKETFLAAAAGQDVTTPTPVTREEVFLDAIAKGGGGGGSSGGGVLVVNDVDGTLDKTWQQIHDADYPVVVLEDNMLGAKNFFGVVGVLKGDVDLSMPYSVVLYNFGSGQTIKFSTPSTSGYPVYEDA